MLSRVSQYHAAQNTVYYGGMAETRFGDRLRRLREAAALTVGQLASTVGVTEGAIRQMESGQTKAASFAVGVRLSRALGVSPEFLATGEPREWDLVVEVDTMTIGIDLRVLDKEHRGAHDFYAMAYRRIAEAISDRGGINVRETRYQETDEAPLRRERVGETSLLSRLDGHTGISALLAMPQAAGGAETEERSIGAEEARQLAQGGLALVQAVQDLRERVEALEGRSRKRA